MQLLFRALSQIQAVFDRDGDVDGDDASLEQPLSDPDEVRWVPGILDNERYYEFAKGELSLSSYLWLGRGGEGRGEGFFELERIGVQDCG